MNPETKSGPTFLTDTNYSDNVSYTNADEATTPERYAWDPKYVAEEESKSPGVLRAEATLAVMSNVDRIAIAVGVFLLSFVCYFNSSVSSTYETFATSEFHNQALISTISIVTTVVRAAVYPPAAKLADIFGRLELLIFAVVLYVVGTVILAACKDVQTYAGGSVVQIFGFTIMSLIEELIMADFTNVRWRYFFAIIPVTPNIITTWASGSVINDVGPQNNWRWGIGMWCIIVSVFSLPLIASLGWVTYKANKQGKLNYDSYFKRTGSLKNIVVDLFWRLDVVGMIFILGALIMILVPLTIAGGVNNQWKEARIIAPLCVGFACIPLFVLWEYFSPHPLLPFHRIKNPYIWAAFGVAIFGDFVVMTVMEYMLNVLYVGYDQSAAAAARISNLYSFCDAVTAPFAGLIIYFTRRLKIWLIFGILCFTLGTGLMVKYRGQNDGGGLAGFIGTQVVMGIGEGFYPYIGQTIAQSLVPHEQLSTVTGLYNAMYAIGFGFGECVSGALWTQRMLPELISRLGDEKISSKIISQAQRELGAGSAPTNGETVAEWFYESPANAYTYYPLGDYRRTAAIESYRVVERLMCIIGVCLCVPTLVFGLFLPNPHLNEHYTLAEPIGEHLRNQNDETEKDEESVHSDNRSRSRKLIDFFI